MQNLLARQHFNIDPASCEYNIKTPNSPRAWQRAPLSLCFYVCVQAAFAARTKRKEHSSSEPPYLTLTGFLWAAVAEAEPVQRKGWKMHQAESHYLLCFPLCHCSRRLSRKFWCNLKLTIAQYNPKFIQPKFIPCSVSCFRLCPSILANTFLSLPKSNAKCEYADHTVKLPNMPQYAELGSSCCSILRDGPKLKPDSCSLNYN